MNIEKIIKIIETDNFFWITICFVIGFFITILVLGCVYINYLSEIKYISNGYERAMLVGNNMTEWVKIKG